MAFRLKQPGPCLCIILLLLSITSFPHAKATSCKCPDSDQDRRSNRTLDEVHIAFHVIDKGSRVVQTVGQDFLLNLSDSDAINTSVLSTIDESIQLWGYRPNQQVLFDEASFSAIILHQPPQNQSGGLAFLILPDDSQAEPKGYTEILNDPLDLVPNGTSGRADISVNNTVVVVIGAISSNTWSKSYGHPMVVAIMMPDPDPTPVAAVASKYVVWIDYDPEGHRLSVYVGLEGKPKPENPIAEMPQSIKSVVSPFVNFGLFYTTAQLLRVRDNGWNVTVSDLPDYFVPVKRGSLLTILASVFGSLVAAAAVAAAFVCYFYSKYRLWDKELTQLAKSIGRLPGVPIRVDFADIRKATNNFDERKEIGGGGFGTVYRCTLPAAYSKTGRPMDVAVKKFTRDVKNGSYEDFLNEVSVVNGLRHRNIVPIVGWAYDKGVPLLVFEFMNNGSLDQHLFPKGGNRERGTDKAIQQWATRYEIARDIATSLHYVHHEYEPMVLHCDIKASNVMLDSSFRARLGDFGLACVVAVDRNSVTVVGGTWGYIAPEYAMCHKVTRQTDIYAFGVLILEVVTGQRALAVNQVGGDHITDRVWRLHREGRLLECVDAMIAADDMGHLNSGDDAERLLLLGLACSHPNPSDRPTMPEVVQVIAKSAPPPVVPRQKPNFVWPPPGWWATDDDTMGMSMMSSLDWSTNEQQVNLGQPMADARTARRYASFQQQSAQERTTARHDSFQLEHSV